MYILRWK